MFDGISGDSDTDTADYDDTPLFTRSPSVRTLPQVPDASRDLLGPFKDEKTDDKLTFFQSSLFATLFEDAATQINILDECNNELRIIKMMSDMETLRRKKFGVQMALQTDELAGINPRNLHCHQYKLNKMVADREYCINVLLATYLELALHKTYDCLIDTNMRRRSKYDYYMELINEEAKNKTTYRELVRQLRQQRNHYKSAIYETDTVIERCKRELEDSTLVTSTRSRYSDQWQLARTEQHTKTIHNKESQYSESIHYFRHRLENEMRVHTEVEVHTNMIITETLEKVDNWMNKYDKDIDSIDLNVQLKKNDYQAQKAKKQEMEKLLADRAEQMNKWIDFKDKREKARQYHKKMTDAAIVVQAWWRGLLVRQALGPFTQKKKGRGKPKGK